MIPSCRRGFPVLLALLLLTGRALAGSFSPDSTGHSLLSRKDLWYGAAAVASVALATRLDGWAADEAPEMNSSAARRISANVGRLGSPLTWAPLLILGGAAGAIAGHPERERSLLRVTAGVLGASAAAGALKLAIGRARPYQTPGDTDVYRPFSGFSSFPSGHTTFAFALAAGIDRETKAKWVPWVVYPLAGAVGWSRLRDGQHWTSDVVGGATLGFWTARKVVGYLRAR